MASGPMVQTTGQYSFLGLEKNGTAPEKRKIDGSGHCQREPARKCRK